MNRFLPVFFLIVWHLGTLANNPIIPNKGANDPHIRIIDGKAYLSASHDKSADNKKFIMEDWWLWSSEDLVNWKLEYTLKPEETYIGKAFNRCWATDIVKRNGKFYWYFSEGNEQTGVMVGDSPSGPWKDPLHKPLLTSDMTPTHEYDLGIFEDTNGDFYIVFGVWDYYIAKLNKDMISLAEKPRKIQINNPRGPYNPDGLNTKMPTDDKPFLHFHNGHYYLSWGCFYAMADNVYGPFVCKGSIMEKESFAPGYDAPTWPNGFKQGRHGSFFEWHNQCYFAYCDISQTANRYFRDTFISYVHYKDNGEMALIRVDGIGVGEYDADNGAIEAEDFFKASDLVKKENKNGGFSISGINNGDYLTFNNIKGLEGKTKIVFNAHAAKNVEIEIRVGAPSGEIITTCSIKRGNNQKLSNYEFDIPTLSGTQNLCFVFRGEGKNLLEFNSFEFISDIHGWKQMFNGNNLDGWEVKCVKQDKNKNYWKVENGTILCDSRGEKDHQYMWLQSVDEFADFEIRLQFQATHENKGNSGIQVRSRYDKTAKVDGEFVGWMDGPQVDIHPIGPWRTGLIYDETRKTRRWISPSLPNSQISKEKYAPQKVIYYWNDEGPGWNDMRIICKGMHITTYVNNIVVSDYDGTGVLDDEAHKKYNVSEKGHIALQLHKHSDNYIRFKNIEIREL